MPADIKRLRITSVKIETPDARTYVLEPLDGWQPVYRSGQFITLIFQTIHGEKRRSYSISSSPELHEPMSVTVKRQDNGEFSRFLFFNARAGEVLHSSGISGFFTLPEDREFGEVCFIAAGSGITPCFSIIKSLLATTKHKVILIYSNKSKEQTIFYDELRQLEFSSEGRFRIKFLFSNSNDIYSGRLSKWLLDQLITVYFPEGASNAIFFVCGPFEYMQTVEITLRMKTSPGNIIRENFSPMPRIVLPLPPDAEGHNVIIRSVNGSYTIPVKYPESILATAKKHGIFLPYSCEAGRCGSCVATCVSGQVWMAYNEVLTEKEVARGRVLTCQAFPVFGDVVIDAAQENS